MKLYFVECSDIELNHYSKEGFTKIYRGSGWKANHIALRELNNHAVEKILSNDETLLTAEEFYKLDDKAKTREDQYLGGRWQIYLWKKNDWKDINDCTNKELRFAHNLTKVYLAGGFDD